ncbi:MAG: hypothetical protein BroJett040_09840 [Oligoflexia bacterium]|nr:MAG: hypothetical protein BroJett040_09840 [Oligoflexia bacterium]
MRSVAIFCISIFCSLQVFAYSNPLIRICRINSGLFTEISVEQPASDKLPFCQFGQALVGSLSILEFQTEGRTSEALRAYKNSADCEISGGSTLQGSADLLPVTFCQFSDGSVIEAETLRGGPQSPHNQMLNQVLGL